MRVFRYFLNFLNLLTLATLFMAVLPARADVVTVALASNVLEPMRRISAAFEAETGHSVRLVNGSTGKLYAQIVNGAPYDIYLSADQERPALLHARGLALVPRTYATGRLVLWGPDVRADATTLARQDFRRLAIADPDLAPYGIAARQALQALALWDGLLPKLVRGENIGQAYAFTATGNAEFGLIALSQIRARTQAAGSPGWVVPDSLHDPIHQDMVVLARAEARPGVQALAHFMRGKTAKDILQTFGYLTGDD